MSFFEWLLTQRRHPRIGQFATWAWSERSPIPRSSRRLCQILVHLEAPPHNQWRRTCKKAHRLYREERRAGESAA